MSNKFTIKLNNSIVKAQDSAKECINLTDQKENENLLKSKAYEIINEFSDSYKSVSNYFFAFKEIDVAIKSFIEDVKKSIETPNYIFFKFIIVELDSISKLIKNDDNNNNIPFVITDI